MIADSCDNFTQRRARKLFFARERVLHVDCLVERWLASQGARQLHRSMIRVPGHSGDLDAAGAARVAAVHTIRDAG
jgi:hypothetical protein